jgi:hypothetical protein
MYAYNIQLDVMSLQLKALLLNAQIKVKVNISGVGRGV